MARKAWQAHHGMLIYYRQKGGMEHAVLVQVVTWHGVIMLSQYLVVTSGLIEAFANTLIHIDGISTRPS